jgi:integrase
MKISDDIQLSNAMVQRVRPGDRDIYVFDPSPPGVSGFGARITPNGHRSWFVQYRMGKGRHAVKKRAVIGDVSDLTAHRAREIAKDWKAKARQGIDPNAPVPPPPPKPESIEALWPRFRDEHVNVHTKAGSQKNARIAFEKHILPALGKRIVTEDIKDDIEALHRSMSATPYGANGMLRALSKFYSWAQGRKMVPRGFNPASNTSPKSKRNVDAIKRYAERRRDRVLNVGEMARLGEALASPRIREEWPVAAACIEALALSGWRSSEMMGLRRDRVDPFARIARLGDSKTGQAVRRISPEVMAIIRAQPVVKGNPFVFPGLYRGDHIKKLDAAFDELRALAGLPDDVTPNTLRHGFMTRASETLDIDLYKVKLTIGHRVHDVTAGYTHLSERKLQSINDRISRALRQMLDGEFEAGELDEAA